MSLSRMEDSVVFPALPAMISQRMMVCFNQSGCLEVVEIELRHAVWNPYPNIIFT